MRGEKGPDVGERGGCEEEWGERDTHTLTHAHTEVSGETEMEEEDLLW